MKDKHRILDRLGEYESLSLELGCGERKRHPGSVGIDRIDGEAVDIVGDAIEVLRSFPAESVSLVTSWHFLEHVEDLPTLITEMGRVLRADGILEATVPHFSHPYYYSDPTHRTPFGLYTFSYLTVDPYFRRQVPSYVRAGNLQLEHVDLVFKSPRPFYFRYAFKKAVGLLLNSSRFMQEFYEENLCYLFPCYELKFLIRKRG